MTGPELKLTEEQVTTLLAQHGSSQVLCALISHWRTLRAALDEQVKESEQFVEQIGMLRKDAVHAEMQRVLIAHNETLDRLTRAEAALASANEITEEKVERALAIWFGRRHIGLEPGDSSYEEMRPQMRAALLAAQGKQPERATVDQTQFWTFGYRNHRGEYAVRQAVPLGVRFGSTEWHPKSQWLRRAFDIAKQAEREFAMDDIQCSAISANHPTPQSPGADRPQTFEQEDAAAGRKPICRACGKPCDPDAQPYCRCGQDTREGVVEVESDQAFLARIDKDGISFADPDKAGADLSRLLAGVPRPDTALVRELARKEALEEALSEMQELSTVEFGHDNIEVRSAWQGGFDEAANDAADAIRRLLTRPDVIAARKGGGE